MNEDLINNQSKSCSNVCRQIVFALTALSWGEIHEQISLNFCNVLPIASLVLCIFYFIFDITQYLYSYVALRNLEISKFPMFLNEHDDKKKESIKINYFLKKVSIEKRTYIIFKIKVSVIPFIVLDLLIYFILRLGC